MQKNEKKYEIHKLLRYSNRWKLMALFAKSAMKFREHHNYYYKPEFTQEEYLKWNDYIKEDWNFRPRFEQSSKNRQFDVYRFDSLEASSKRPHKKFYSLRHFHRDMAQFFTYLPLTEVRRMVHCFVWLMKEALKNYGWLVIPGFGTFCLFDKPLRETHKAFSRQRWSAIRHRLRRSIEFYPSTHLHNIVTPRTTLFMGFEGKYNRAQYIPEMFGSFVDERIHRYRGRLFFQDVFDKQWNWLGYSDDAIQEYRNMYSFDIISSHDPYLDDDYEGYSYKKRGYYGTH